MFSKHELLKFRPVLESPLWDRFEEDILEPLLKNNSKELETVPLDKVERIRGKVETLRMFLTLRENARTAFKETE